jgi:hypothetical protein
MDGIYLPPIFRVSWCLFSVPEYMTACGNIITISYFNLVDRIRCISYSQTTAGVLEAGELDRWVDQSPTHAAD